MCNQILQLYADTGLADSRASYQHHRLCYSVSTSIYLDRFIVFTTCVASHIVEVLLLISQTISRSLFVESIWTNPNTKQYCHTKIDWAFLNDKGISKTFQVICKETLRIRGIDVTCRKDKFRRSSRSYSVIEVHKTIEVNMQVLLATKHSSPHSNE